MIFCPRKRLYLLRHTSAVVVFASIDISVPCGEVHASKIFGSNASTSRSLCFHQKTHMPRFTAVDVHLAAAVLPSKCRYCRSTAVNVLSRCVTHTDILPITCCHRMPHCWHIYALTQYTTTLSPLCPHGVIVPLEYCFMWT